MKTVKNTIEELQAELAKAQQRIAELEGILQAKESKLPNEMISISNNKYKVLFESAASSIFIMDGETIVDCNQMTGTIFGCERDKIIGQSPVDFSPITQPNGQLSSEKAKALIEMTLAGKSQRFEWLHTKYNGSLFYAEVILNRISLEDKYFIQAIITDISEQKQAISDIMSSEEKFRVLTEQIADVIYTTDNAAKITYISPSAVKIFGYKPEEMIGKNFVEFLAETEIQKALTAFQTDLETGIMNQSLNLIMKKKDGFFFGELSSSILTRNNEIEGVTGIIRDVSHKVLAEKELIESEEKFRLVVKNSHAVIFILDKEGKFLLSEGLALAKLGLQPGQVVGMSSFEVYKDYPEIVHSIEMALKGELARTSSVVAGAYFDVSYSPYVDRFGQVIGVIGIASDVTERKLAEEAIQKRLVALTKPLSSIADIEFDELFNLDEIQKVQDSFANATGVASIITLPNGTPITQPSNFTRLCNDIIRTTEKGCENCYYSDSVVGRQNNDGPIIQPCLSCGLWDAGASITIAGKHIANWLIGQVRNSDIDEKKILNYAEVIGADKEEFKLALEEVPVMSYEQFEKISQALFIFANELSTKAYQNVQQARFIIEKQRTEDDLNKAYQKLNLHFEQAPIGVIEWNMEHKVINWNPSAEKIFGYTKQEAMGQHASFILPEGVRNLADEVFNGLLKQNGGKQVTNENIRKDGAILTCEWYNTALVDNNSKTIGFASLIQDITDRVNAEEALKAREKSFRVLYNNTPVMLHSIDNNGKLLSVSDFWLNAMGYERDEVLGRRSTEFLSEKSKKYALEVVLPEFMRTGECKNIEYQFVKKNGEIIEALMSAISEKDENGDIIRSLAVINDISIRKKTEELLRQSEQTYRGILDSINEAVYIESLDGYFIEVNKAAEKMYGYEREFFVGKTPEFLAAPGKNDLSQLKPILQKAVEGNPQTFEFWGKDKNGRIFPKEVSNTLGYYFGQKVIIAVARDITDRKQSEDSIKRLNRVYTVLSNINQTIVRIQDIQELFDKTCQIAIDDGDFKMAWIGMINEESQMVEIVAEAGNSLDYLQKVRDGITLEEISKYPVGRALTTGEHYFSNDIANDPDTEIIRESALANGFNSVVSLPIKIGGTTKGIFTLFAGENFFDEDEIKLLDELAMDISFALEFMEREKERKKVENALAESEMIFNSFMKYSPNYIFFKDSEIRTIRLSDNFEQWLGKPLEEMLNKTMYDLFPSELAKNIIEDDKRILNEGNVVTVDEEFGGRYYTTIKFPIYQDDKPIYIAGFTIDITERKLAEEEIRKLNSELEAKVIERTSTLQSTLEQLQESNLELNTLNKQVMKDSESILNLNEDLIISQEKLQEAITTKDKFFSIIAHDLRSPFAGFLLLSEMMSKDVDTLTIAEIKKMGLSINNSANALFKLLDSLLMWSRSQLGKIPYQPEQIDIYEIAHNAAVSMMGNAEAKQIQIIIDIKQPTLVLCDSNMMTTVFRNLLSNAIKFSKEGSIVRMDIEEMTDVLQISIKDNGVGLSQNKIDKLFKLDEHMTTKGTKGESGSGLGLVICKEFVEKHGGKIWVDSEEGKGSSFYFTLIKN